MGDMKCFSGSSQYNRYKNVLSEIMKYYEVILHPTTILKLRVALSAKGGGDFSVIR